MRFGVSEHLDNDPIYKELVAQRDEIGRMLNEYDRQNPAAASYGNEAVDIKYKRYADEFVELSNRISEYERAAPTEGVDNDSQGLV
jgi:hypothetical protein